MRALLTIPLAAVLALAACDSDPVAPGGPGLPPDVAAALAEDAAVLAVDYQLAVARDSDTVALPPALVESLRQSLVRVRQSESGALVDGVRAFPSYTLRDVLIAADPSVTWTDAWSRGERLTGYAPIDDRVRRYGLALARYDEYRDVKSARLRSDVPVNTVALARAFGPVPDLRYAEPNGIGGDGDDIEAERLLDGWRLDFSRGSGDCPAGCINRTYWTFRVTGAGVEYLGTRGR